MEHAILISPGIILSSSFYILGITMNRGRIKVTSCVTCIAVAETERATWSQGWRLDIGGGKEIKE